MHNDVGIMAKGKTFISFLRRGLCWLAFSRSLARSADLQKGQIKDTYKSDGNLERKSFLRVLSKFLLMCFFFENTSREWMKSSKNKNFYEWEIPKLLDLGSKSFSNCVVTYIEFWGLFESFLYCLESSFLRPFGPSSFLCPARYSTYNVDTASVSMSEKIKVGRGNDAGKKTSLRSAPVLI